MSDEATVALLQQHTQEITKQLQYAAATYQKLEEMSLLLLQAFMLAMQYIGAESKDADLLNNLQADLGNLHDQVMKKL